MSSEPTGGQQTTALHRKKTRCILPYCRASDRGCQPAVVDTKLTVSRLPTATVTYFFLKTGVLLSRGAQGKGKYNQIFGTNERESLEWCLFSMACSFFCLGVQLHTCPIPVRTRSRVFKGRGGYWNLQRNNSPKIRGLSYWLVYINGLKI